MDKKLYSRRLFFGKGLVATALVAGLPAVAKAALLGGEDPKDLKRPAGKPKPTPKYESGNQLPKPLEPARTAGPLPEPAPADKVVLLVGSHHNKALQDRVQKLLEGKACVYAPAANCGNTVDVLRQLPQWIKDYNPDVVHLSTGFEDIRTLYYGSTDAMVPRTFYKRNVRQILDFVYGLSDKAVPIWATVPPVQDEWLAETKSRVRDWTFFSDDVDAYNREAMKICRKMKVNVNDLNTVVSYAGIDGLMDRNGYEFNPKGLAAVAQAMAARIESFL